MSRHGYTDCDDGEYPFGLWRGVIASATRGKRGQKFFKELLAALDAMPAKELHARVFDDPDEGKVCALGALARVKGIDTTQFDPEESEAAEVLAAKFDVADCLTRETIYANDDGFHERYIRLDFYHLHGVGWACLMERPDERWQRMRDWVAKQIKAAAVKINTQEEGSP